MHRWNRFVIHTALNRHGLMWGLDAFELPAIRPAQRILDDEAQAYAAAVIHSLRDERNLERQAHEQTRQHADSRILELEAQLARRDAELEACLIYDKNNDTASHHSKRTPLPPNMARDVPRMTNEEALEVMGTTSARNKVLEQEVRGLSHMVRSSCSSHTRIICPSFSFSSQQYSWTKPAFVQRHL